MKIKKRNSIIIIIIVILIGVVGYCNLAPYYRKIYSGKVWKNGQVSNEENILFDFVDNKLMGEEGEIYTNYINEASCGDITKGHAILSESQGIMLLYNLEKNDKENFDFTLKYIKDNMILNNNLLSWRIEDGERSETSATIDDFRVVKALLLANEKWGDFEYRKLAIKIANGIHKNLLDENIVTDFEDGHTKSDTTTLCYLDLPTLKMLSNIDYNSWKKVYDKSLEIIDGGYISDDIPLYRKTFYRKDKIYDTYDGDTLLSMIVVLNKLEENQDVSSSIEWIRKEFQQKGALVTSYSSENGMPTSNIESTSIYSLVVQIANRIGDKEIQNFAMNKVKAFQVKNINSIVYGGYGSEDGLNVYSYDNLNALLAYRNFY